jgi:hypothetical protein
MSSAFADTMARVREIVSGEAGGVRFSIEPGRFRPTSGRIPLALMEESAAFHGSFEVLPVGTSQPAGGPANVSGAFVDSTAICVVRVGYLQGGAASTGTATVIGDSMVDDAMDLRRAIEEPTNHDGTGAGVLVCDWTESKFSFADPPDRRALLEVQFKFHLQDRYY